VLAGRSGTLHVTGAPASWRTDIEDEEDALARPDGMQGVMPDLGQTQASGPADDGGRCAPSESLRLLCRCLAAPRGPEPNHLRDALKANVDWVGLAGLANAFLVAPALWRSLETKGLMADVPADFRDYLGAIYRANAIRMEAIRREARRAVAALNACGIAPLVLKGAARLFEAEPDAAHARMMADLDLLVEAPRLDAALAALGAAGYEIVAEAPGPRRHAITLRSPGEPAAIDLHHDIGPQRDFIPLADAVADAATASIAECRIRIPSPTHRVMHIFFHCQVHDRGHVGGDIPLRHLEDFAWIVARHGPAIDWAAIGRACDRQRLRREWDAWLFMAEHCLGVAMPGSPRRPWRAWLHYRRCLLQLDHAWLDAILRSALAMTEPLSYANIIYKHGCGASSGALLRARALETANLLGKYRHRVPQRLLAAIRDAGGRAS
jgi:hypothetical protein